MPSDSAYTLLRPPLVRKPRKQTLGTTGLFHKMWRGHNREPVLEDPQDKLEYCRHLAETYTDEIKQKVEAYSICLMTNHDHESGGCKRDEAGSLNESINTLGNWMRNAHSRFGAAFNRKHNRQGKVAYDRPKTTEIASDEDVLRVMFYGDANPVAAGMVSHPSQYRYSSYRLYAYGETSAFTSHLVPPPAYLALGATPEARQKKYRRLCDKYLIEVGLRHDQPDEGLEPRPEDAAGHPPQNETPPLARGDPTSLLP